MLTWCLLTLSLSGADTPEARELAKFQGTWRYSENSERAKGRLVISGLKCQVFRVNADGTLEFNHDFNFQLGVADRLRTFDVTDEAGDWLGIYETDGHILVICLGLPGRQRPTHFGGPDRDVMHLAKVSSK